MPAIQPQSRLRRAAGMTSQDRLIASHIRGPIGRMIDQQSPGITWHFKPALSTSAVFAK
jgi:hypothetical protein